jgi:hypothetical protein
MEALATADPALDARTAAALAEMEQLTVSGTSLSASERAALSEFEALAASGRIHRKPSDDAALAQMMALTATDPAHYAKIAVGLAEMEQFAAAGAAFAARQRPAEKAALAELEALATLEPSKPKPTASDGATPEPRYSLQVERALYQSQIELVDAFRPTPRKRRRSPGLER